MRSSETLSIFSPPPQEFSYRFSYSVSSQDRKSLYAYHGRAIVSSSHGESFYMSFLGSSAYTVNPPILFPRSRVSIRHGKAGIATLSSTSQDAAVVLGGGVIGLSTAYYLALALDETRPGNAFKKHPIYIVESSKDVCDGASGQATGGLGDFGFGPETAPLGLFSFRLDQELTTNADGKNTYYYSPLNIFRVSPIGNSSGANYSTDTWGPWPPQPVDLDVLPAWVRRSPD